MFHVAPWMWIIVNDGCILYVYMRNRGLCGPVSVCPSVCHVIHRVEDIVKLLSRSGSPIILVFFTPSRDTQFQGKHRHRRCKIHGRWENFAIFD